MMPAPYSADLRWRVIWFVMLSRGQLAAVRKAVSVGSLSNTTSTEARTLSENVTSRFCNHLSIMKNAILQLNWNQRLGQDKDICHHMLTSPTQLQKRSFHVIERTRTSSKCQKMKNARAKILFFIVKYANLWGFCCRRRRGCSLV